MTDIMDWNLCKREFLKEVETDPAKINSIIKTAESRLEMIKSLEANMKNCSFVVEGYYEVIKELLVALLLSRGLRAKNHQCLISYFYKNYPRHEAEAHLIAQMSYFRNRLDYYGELISIDFYEKNKADFNKIIAIIRSLINTK